VELTPTAHAERASTTGVLASSNYFNTQLAARPHACPRYESLISAAAAHPAPMTVEQMESALYGARMRGLNLQAVVFEPAALKMHVSINRLPAAAGPYVPLELTPLFATPRVGQTASAPSSN